MKHSSEKYLLDVLKCIDEIKLFTKELKNAEELKANLILMRCIEREFEIIGEALSKYLKIVIDSDIREVKRIISLRNLIIHAYDNVDYIMLWRIIENNLSDLEFDVKKELNKEV